ncbi:DUF3253 domain-containing protein [Janibacter sp. LM]|uniref:DUF3253 domain-containing protein n=1 Tax=Janibacter sp. LM TaxID=3144845 RepID=UPI0031F63233
MPHHTRDGSSSDRGDGSDGVEHVDDGRYVLVDGRRWRASDPAIPDALRAELVSELMAARRAVRTDPGTARPRVHDAKVALGERGHPWWEDADEQARRERIAATFRVLLRHRDPRSACPSDIARAVGGPGWRDLMDEVRAVAAALAADGTLVVTQGGQPVDVRTARGPVRVVAGPRLGAPSGS